MTGAGQIVRRDVRRRQAGLQVARAVEEPLQRPMDARIAPVVDKTFDYIAQLRRPGGVLTVETRLGRARPRRARRPGRRLRRGDFANIGVCVAEARDRA